MNTPYTKASTSLCILIAVLVGTSSSRAVDGNSSQEAPMRMGGHDLALSGAAKGGSLLFFQVPSRNSKRWAEIQTRPGESAEVVAARLADRIGEVANVFGWAPGDIKAHGASLGSFPFDGLNGMWILAGTESGLGIPAPPTSLTARYERNSQMVHLKWVNPEGGYNSIALVCNGLGRASFPGTLTEHSFKGDPNVTRNDAEEQFFRNPNDMTVCVVGYKGSTPSNAACIHLKGNTQAETMGIPFAGGIAPNWSIWSTGSDSSVVECSEGRRGPDQPKRTKPTFQQIRIRQPGVQGGVYRLYLGLVPGHTYRLSAWMNTISHDDRQGDWSYSLHMAALPDSAHARLTSGQFSGQEASIFWRSWRERWTRGALWEGCGDTRQIRPSNFRSFCPEVGGVLGQISHFKPTLRA